MNVEGKAQSGLGRSGDNVEKKLNQTKDDEKHIDRSSVKHQISSKFRLAISSRNKYIKLLTTDFTDVRFVVFPVKKMHVPCPQK